MTSNGVKFSIITPAWKAERWVRETIESVISQAGDFDIEYIFVVDPSEDRTEEIAKEYEQRITSGAYPIRAHTVTMRVFRPEIRSGMYAALNAGFALATGDIYAWIAADDGFEPGAFQAMAEAFTALPDVEWLKGISSSVDENGHSISRGVCRIYHRDWLKAGVYGMEAYHVEQDSVFWRASLWKKIGGFPPTFKSMGDYWLWLTMAKYARLWSINIPVSFFRKQPGQDSKVNAERCKQQMWTARGNRRPLRAWLPRLYFYPYYHIFPSSMQPLMRQLYPLFFPFRSREYFEIENGQPVKRTMPSFVLY